MWADAQRDGPNIGGALCKSSVIPFLVPRCKVWLTSTAPVPCSNAANIGERKIWTQREFCTGQNSAMGQEWDCGMSKNSNTTKAYLIRDGIFNN